ncbi:MAG: YfhO family protein, partial [Oscillospiraceae bacterium]|nr:YfhO family protein [Oscillospiraceae bacterium]
FLYSWRTGLGTNFLSLMAYYIASPLNLLSVFMNLENLRDGMMVILMLKFSFAGFFMAKCLRYVFHKNDLSITMFGIMYALCSYMVGYYWNTIWIDTVAMLPLVMMGLTMLVREGKYRVYVISLAVALFSNYYIAYFICIFTVIAFFCLCLYENINFKKFFKRFALITGSSLLGAGLSSFILLPTLFALQLTYSINNTFPKTISFYEKWRDIVSNMLAYTEVTSKDGLPNLYCGLLPVLLLGVFLIAKKIRIREKISSVLILVFLVVSCNMNYLNFIWHGFHFTNMLPYRFSFLFSFVVLIMGYRAYQVLLEEKLHILHWVAMLLIGAGFCWLAYGSGIQEEENHAFVKSSAILGAVYLVIILFRFMTLINISEPTR